MKAEEADRMEGGSREGRDATVFVSVIFHRLEPRASVSKTGTLKSVCYIVGGKIVGLRIRSRLGTPSLPCILHEA